jgi:DNA replication protein DnaC
MVSAETDDLTQRLTRLTLTAIRDQLDALLDEAARRQMSLRETVVFLCEAEVARKDERRVHMAQSLAKFPYLRTLEDVEFDAQPSLDPRQIRDLATCRWIANGDALLVQGPPGVGKTHVSIAHRVRCRGERRWVPAGLAEVIADRTRPRRRASATGSMA